MLILSFRCEGLRFHGYGCYRTAIGSSKAEGVDSLCNPSTGPRRPGWSVGKPGWVGNKIHFQVSAPPDAKIKSIKRLVYRVELSYQTC